MKIPSVFSFNIKMHPDTKLGSTIIASINSCILIGYFANFQNIVQYAKDPIAEAPAVWYASMLGVLCPIFGAFMGFTY